MHLLSTLSQQLHTYHQSTSHQDFYNIFQVLGVAEKETVMCRMLADLLDPKGDHGQGNAFLKGFLEQVLRLEYTDEQLQTATVHREYMIPGSDRRIDLVIETENRFIPIEVKIHARDQKSQCYDYWAFAVETMDDEEAVIYYLTKYGTMPSAESVTSEKKVLPEDKIKVISFEKDIRQWLKNCASIGNDRVQLCVAQYLDAIEDFTGAIDEDIAEMTKKTILSSKAYFEAALFIEKSMEDAKLSLMESLFEALARRMDDMTRALPFVMSRMDAYCYDYKRRLGAYYSKGQRAYPSIAYAFDDIPFLDGRKLLLYVTADEYLYAGVVLYDPVKGDEADDISPEEEVIIKAHIKVANTDDDCFFGYLPELTGDDQISDDTSPNFKTMQGVVISLVEEAALNDFVEKAVGKIGEKLVELAIQ